MTGSNRERKDQEENYRILIENIPSVLWKTDKKGHTDFISPNVEDVYGFTPQEIYENGSGLFLDRIHPEDVRRVRKAWQDLFQTQIPYDIEYRIQHKDGRWIWLHDKAVAVVQEGEETFIIGLFTDITENRLIQEKLKQSEEKYRRLTENALDVIYRMSLPDGAYEYVNPASTEVLGYTPEEFYETPKLIKKIIHPDWHAYFEREWEKLVKGDMPPEYEYQVIHGSGEVRWVNQRNVLVLDEHGSPEAIEGIVTDITKRKKMEEDLTDREAKLRQAQEIALMGHYIFDITSGTWTSSSTLDRLFGIEKTYVKTVKGWLALVHPDDREEMFEYLRDYVIAGRNLFDKEYRITRKSDGSTRWVYGKGDLKFSDDGTPQTMFGIIQDITSDKESEEKNRVLQNQLQQAQKLEAIGQLAGGVAHDFNNLLTGISGYAELLLADLQDGKPKQDDLVEIKKAADKAASLTAQLLAFSRKQVIAPRKIDLNALIDDAAKMLQRLIGEDIEMSFSPGRDLGSVYVDPHQIEQVLINLAVNARDAMPGGGKLTIETANVSIDLKAVESRTKAVPGDYVLLTVSDSGSGMPPEVRERLFEPFFTTKEGKGGTGLGLSVIYGIVQQNKGFIDVYSEVGLGSTFKVYVPKAKGEADPEPMSQRDSLQHGTETILLVEDEAMVRILARDILSRYGYKVKDVEFAEKALELARDTSAQIDLLLTDVIMPKMNGPQLYKQISSLRPDLPVLYMSGYTGHTIAQHGILEEEAHFIQKPFTITNLVSKVREVLDGSAGTKESA